MGQNKRNKGLLLAIFICMALIFTLPAAGFAMTGTGTSADPYMIYNATDLQSIKNNLSANYRLANDIDMSGVDFQPIDQGNFFKGTLDGASHAIKNINIKTGKIRTGFFEIISGATIQNLNIELPTVNSTRTYTGVLAGSITNSTIKNINITGANIASTESHVGVLAGAAVTGTIIQNINITLDQMTSTGYMGGLVGSISVAQISNAHVRKIDNDAIISGNGTVGGLVGWVDNSTISKCSSNVNTSGNDCVGGLVGFLHYNGIVSSISNSYAGGNVTGVGAGNIRIGGLIGYATTGDISNSFAYGDVSGFSYVGGFIGHANGSTNPTNITNCYSVGQVQGGFSGGYSSGSIVTNCYYDNSKTTRVDAKATAMTHEASFQQTTYVGFDFNSVWDINEGVTTPYLQDMPIPEGWMTLSSNADLKDLSVNQYLLSGEFSVTPVASDAKATIKVNGQSVSSGSASQRLTLSSGTNTVTIVVTAEDGVTTKTYTETFNVAVDTP